jgi:hypothetical protein
MATNHRIEYLRTMVRGDFEANNRIEQELDSSGWKGWPIFLACCFYFAVDRHFKRPADLGQIVRFVAEIRAWIGEDWPDIDPLMTERLVRSVLDESVDIDVRALDQEMLGRIETAVVYRILTSSDLSDAELDAFLERAAKKAAEHEQ